MRTNASPEGCPATAEQGEEEAEPERAPSTLAHAPLQGSHAELGELRTAASPGAVPAMVLRGRFESIIPWRPMIVRVS